MWRDGGSGNPKQPADGQGHRGAACRARATVALTARTMNPDPKYQGWLRQTRDETAVCQRPCRRGSGGSVEYEERAGLFGEVVGAVGAPGHPGHNAAVNLLRTVDGMPGRRVRLMTVKQVLAPLHLSQLAISRCAPADGAQSSTWHRWARTYPPAPAVLRI